MKSFKLAGILLCIALISEHSQAVLNKSTKKNVNNENSGSDKKSDKNAEDRISNEYGVPLGPSFNGPAPVYGPPELTGNHAPVQVFPPPPPELPPLPPPQISVLPGQGPLSLYGPSRGPPQLQFPPRPMNLAPWQLSPPSPRFPQKPSGHGPPIPISLEAYGPPVNAPVSSFSHPQNNYGLPRPLALPNRSQLPPPGVPAPPTPPDIKYDGWQPIAGHVEAPKANIHTPPSVNLDHSANVNLPSNSYGEPINNPEDHSLRQSIGQNDQGLPPPLLPEAEPLHNIQEAAQSLPALSNPSESLSTATNVLGSFNSDSISGYDVGHGSGNYNQDLSLQLPLQGPSPGSDFHGAPPSAPGPISNSYGQPPSGPASIGDSYGPPSSGPPAISDSYGGPPSGPGIPAPRPISGSYGAPPSSSSSFSYHGPHASSHASNFGSGLSFTSGSSFSSGFNSAFRQPHRHPSSFFQSHTFRNHGPARPNLLSHSLIPPRNRAPTKFRESVPSGLFNSINHYIPPSQIHSTGPIKPANTYGPARGFGFNLQQQPPTLTQPISFHSSNTAATTSTDFGTSSSSAFGRSPLAAPNVNYGTPLTFTSFNTPAPVLTYGAPNFGPSTTFISSNVGRGNLYNQHNSISTAYGTPLPANQLFNGQHDCSGYQKPIETPIQLTSFSQSQGNLDSSLISQYQSLPSINELALEPTSSIEQQQIEIKDSYGNPTASGYDQRSSSSSSSSIASNYNSETIINGASAEALTAALTAQGYSQTSDTYNNDQRSTNYNDQHNTDNNNQDTNNAVSTNTLNVDQLTQLHGDSEPAIALAQTLSAEGASDGFQIQGSKGTYLMQIQSVNGLHQNSDGSIRHDQLLSDGLLQDILAAIEQPSDGGRNQFLEIQGSPQAQQLSEIHQQEYQYESHDIHDHDDLSRAATSSIANAAADDAKTDEIMNTEDIALFFNNNYTDDSAKEIRSTAKSEGNAVDDLKKVSEENTTEKST